MIYEGPTIIDVQYAIVGRRPTARPCLGDPVRIAGVRVSDYDWPSYDPQHHLQPDGSLVVDNFILELFDQDGNDQSFVQHLLPRDPLR